MDIGRGFAPRDAAVAETSQCDHLQCDNHCKGQQCIAAVALLREMQDWQMQADVITYHATISACEKGQQWIKAVASLRELQEWQIRPNVITCNAIISAYEKGKQ